MSAEDKEYLITVIKGLTQIVNQTQYDEGEKVIKGKNIDFLIRIIKNM